ncbi:MAG TPA: toll/interleukin-1 receptor domain-containing protein, partial [Pyrinomonadaceae bacterium]|nr:toll/interleukin-1 receptor domain-containing protein [Pyrinomonadaceae bacterium]
MSNTLALTAGERLTHGDLFSPPAALILLAPKEVLMPAVNIFISYRRDDASAHAGRIFDRLDDRFPGAVFMDVAGLGPGVNFVRAIEQKLASCHLFVVVIGTSWLRILRERDAQADEPDYVRIELAAALRKGIPVIPLLVQGAQMPRRSDLPDDLKALRDHNAVVIDDHEFRDDLGRLIKAIEGLHPQPPRPGPSSDFRPKPAGLPFWLTLCLGLGAAAIVGVVILVAALNISPGPSNTGFDEEPVGGVTPPPPPYANDESFTPAGTWTVTRRDAQQFVFDLTLGGDGAVVQFPAGTQAGRWNYDEGRRTLMVYAPNGGVMVNLRVTSWHDDHFHGQLLTPGGAIEVS